LSGHRRNKVGRFIVAAATWVGSVVGISAVARADGAFPDAQSVLLPRDRPNEIVLATNFGLVFTEDDGLSWTFTCETDAQTQGGYRYIVGPPSAAGPTGGVSGDRLFAVSVPPPGAPVSLDDGCSWTQAAGALTDPGNPVLAFDVFPDPSDASRVFLLGVPQSLPDAPGSVYRSLDGGLTYAGPLFTPPAGGSPTMTGVEVSASAPGIVYVTWYERVGDHPHLSRSNDGGGTWTDVPVEAALGPGKPYLAGVDPTDPQTVVLRLLGADGVANPFEGLARTRDGGLTWTVPLRLPGGSLEGFVRRQDGTLVAIGTMSSADGPVPTSSFFESTDDGATFSTTPLAFHGKGLAERDGTLFMATDNYKDLVALVSSEDGVTWKPRMRFDQISAIRACVFATCQNACDLLGGLTIFPPQTCDAPTDGGAGDASPRDAGADKPGSAPGGCGCSAGGASVRTPAQAAGLGAQTGVLAVAFGVARRRRRGRRA